MPSLKRKSEGLLEDGRTGSAGIEANAAGRSARLGARARISPAGHDEGMFEFVDGRQLFLHGLRVAPVRQRADFDPVSRLARNLTGNNTYIVAFVFKLPGNSARVRIPAIGRDLNHPHRWRIPQLLQPSRRRRTQWPAPLFAGAGQLRQRCRFGRTAEPELAAQVSRLPAMELSRWADRALHLWAPPARAFLQLFPTLAPDLFSSVQVHCAVESLALNSSVDA